MFGKLRDSWVVWRRKVGEKLDTQSETLEDYGETLDEYGETLDTYGDKLDTYNPVAKTEDMSTPVGVDSDGKLWTSGGGSGETREPLFSFDVVAETPYQMNGVNSADFMANSMILDVYVGNTQFYLGYSEKNGNIITMYFNDDDNNIMTFSVTVGNAISASVTSPISGTLSAYANYEYPLVIYGLYENDEIVISDHPAEVILSNIIGVVSAVAILSVEGEDAAAKGYLTVSRYVNNSTILYNISCDIDIDGKFNFAVDENDNIVGTKVPK